MDAVVPEARIALDARLLGKDVIVLALEVLDDLRKALWCEFYKKTGRPSLSSPGLIVDLVAKARRINDCERDARSFFVELQVLAQSATRPKQQGKVWFTDRPSLA